MIESILAAVVIFAILIIVHEAGHFAMAKRMGVRVLRFSIGYPPRIWGIRRGETDYAIGATPLGGYVRMLGDEIASEPSSETIKGFLEELKLDLVQSARSAGLVGTAATDAALTEMAHALADDKAEHFGNGAALESKPKWRIETILGREPRPDETIVLREIALYDSVPLAVERLAERRPSALISEFNRRAFPSQSLGRRFAIVLAGPCANILFAPLLLIVVFISGFPVALPTLGVVSPDMPGFAAGLSAGDQVLAVDGLKIDSWDDFSMAVKHSGGRPLVLSIERTKNGAPREIQITVKPKLLSEQTIYGDEEPTWVIGVRPSGAETIRHYSVLEAVPKGFVETARMTATLCIGIAKIVEGATPVREALGGPIMIAQIAGKEARQGFADVALFMVMVSLELGIINLLPIPLLDGGHLLFFIIEGVKGEPLKLRHREIAMQVGLFLLVILMAFVILNDISRLIG
jgi:regulator of sigma E protease